MMKASATLFEPDMSQSPSGSRMNPHPRPKCITVPHSIEDNTEALHPRRINTDSRCYHIDERVDMQLKRAPCGGLGRGDK